MHHVVLKNAFVAFIALNVLFFLNTYFKCIIFLCNVLCSPLFYYLFMRVYYLCYVSLYYYDDMLCMFNHVLICYVC